MQSMKANLIYNPNAGGSQKVDLDSILASFRDIGWEVTHLLTTTEEDLDKVLKDISGYLIVIGGDGTLRAVATRLIGTTDTTIIPIPLGTANNITNSLGITLYGTDLIPTLTHTKTIKYDVGHITAPWGEDYFLEAVGVGLFADSMAMYDPKEGKSLRRALGTMRSSLPAYTPHDFTITLDNSDQSGQYVLFEVLNTKATGPRLRLAPQANPSDGYLDAVGIRANERTTILTYLRGLMGETLTDLHNVDTQQVKKVDIVWTGFPVHVDGILRTEIEDEDLSTKQTTNPNIAISILPAALTFLLPDHD